MIINITDSGGWECPKRWSLSELKTNNDTFQAVLSLTWSKKTEFHLWERNGI